jgi:heme/copper-type cytochrome/quinol oxidase subunit 2
LSGFTYTSNLKKISAMLWSNAFFVLTIIGLVIFVTVVVLVKVDELREKRRRQRPAALSDS